MIRVDGFVFSVILKHWKDTWNPTQQTIHAEVKRKQNKRVRKLLLRFFAITSWMYFAISNGILEDAWPSSQHEVSRTSPQDEVSTIHVQYYKVLTPVVNKKRGVSLKFKTNFSPSKNKLFEKHHQLLPNILYPSHRVNPSTPHILRNPTAPCWPWFLKNPSVFPPGCCPLPSKRMFSGLLAARIG